jgi:phosphate transport system substrate-binding protein
MRFIAALLSLVALQDRLSPDLLEYQPSGQLKGTLQLGPSAGFEHLLERLAERLKQHHADLRGGRVEPASPAMPEAMISGSSRIGFLARRWTLKEAADFRFQWGFPLRELVIGTDAIAIVVHPQNPIRGLLVDDVDSIFSSARKRGGKPIRAWGELGLEGEWKKLPITLYGLDKSSPARTFFQDKALQGGDFQKDVKELSGADAVLQAVAEDPCAIGYLRGCVRTDRCRGVPLHPSVGAPAVEPRPETVLSLSYPLSWRVYLAVRKEPGEAIELEVRELLRLILSRDGQEVVAEEGLLPITGRMARQELLKLK